MRSKRKFSLLILLTLFLLMVPPASAHLGTDVNSRWLYTQPTIDGTISSGEWTDATVRDFTLEMRDRNTGALNRTLNARFYVKNNLTHIAAAVQVFGDDYEAANMFNNYDGCALLFDNDHNGTVDAGENGEGGQAWDGAPFYSNNDLYYNTSSGGYWDYDTHLSGKHNDGAMKWSHTNATQGAIGDWTFEMLIPLVGSDAGYDMAITTLPKTVGFKIWFMEPGKGLDGVYPDNSTITQNGLEIKNGATFGNLILHPRYTLTITTTAGGTTNQTSGVTYGWGEVASVLAMPYSGYMFDHWELDTVPVGSANPYSVTMNQNHTLHAVFRLLPPPTVGGMAAPIVIQMNEPNLLSPLIWLASVIIPIALTVVFVKLKKKKL